MSNGCMIDASELMNVLAAFKAQKDDEDKFMVRGNITSFMGAGDEFLLDDTAQYLRDGKWQNLLVAIKATSYYRPVQVF